MCHRVPVAALRGQLILVAEDEPLIAMDAEAALRASGADVIVVRDLESGLAAARQRDLAAAILDVHLHDQTVEPLCDHLDDEGIPFVFATGDPYPCQDRWKATILDKPLRTHDLLEAVAFSLVNGCCQSIEGKSLLELQKEARQVESRLMRQSRRISTLQRECKDTRPAWSLLHLLEAKLDEIFTESHARAGRSRLQ